MTAKVTRDRAGRLMLPKQLRQELHLVPGDVLELESHGDQIALRVERPKARIIKEMGVWVFDGEATEVSIPDWLDQERQKRIREFVG